MSGPEQAAGYSGPEQAAGYSGPEQVAGYSGPEQVAGYGGPEQVAGYGVWGELIGQSEAVALLDRAALASRRVLKGASGPSVNAMTHAWLLTGPPGAGTGLAVRAFAAALQCTGAQPGCGVCQECHTTLGGTHPDVTVEIGRAHV